MGNQIPVAISGSRNFRQLGSKSNSSGSMDGCIGGRTSKCYFVTAKAELTCGTSVSYTMNYHNHSAEDGSFENTCQRLQIRSVIENNFSYFSTKTYVVGTQKNHFGSFEYPKHMF